MKKIVLTIVCALATTGAAFAQGTLAWNTISPAAMTAQTNATAYSPLFGGFGSPVGGAVGATGSGSTSGLQYYYELLYTTYSGSQIAQPTSISSLLSWSDTGLTATNSSVAGFLNPVGPNVSASVAGWANGTTNSIMLVGWSANLGTDWATVSAELNDGSYISVLAGQNGFFGMSTTGYINPNLAPAGGAVLFGTSPTANGLPIKSLNTQLYLLPVPEPTTIALAGLGGLSLLLFRRRKV